MLNSQNITLVEGNHITESQELVSIVSDLFSNAIKKLGIIENTENNLMDT